MAQQSIKLIEKKALTDNVLELRFEKPSDFTYQAGQFVQFFFPQGEKMTPRSYSISSSPEKEYLEFCVKLIPGGLGSERFRALEIGQTSTIDGPRGRFIADPEKKACVFIATGVGLAPIMGIIQDQIAQKKETDMKLLFGVRSENDLFWIDRLDACMTNTSFFSYEVTVSQPIAEDYAGQKGRVTAHIDQYINTEAAYYLCGAGEMVKEVRDLLIQKNVPPKEIHFEIF